MAKKAFVGGKDAGSADLIGFIKSLHWSANNPR